MKSHDRKLRSASRRVHQTRFFIGWSRGQTYAEFMMVVLPTLSIIFGIFSLAMTVYTWSFLSNAARDAVRYAIVHGSRAYSGQRGRHPDLRA